MITVPVGFQRSLPGWRTSPLALWMAVLMGLLASPVAQAQALWGGSAVGMSVEQVRQRFPGAVAPDAPDVLYSGATEALRVPGLELAGQRFQASFFFLDGRLAQVTLGLIDIGSQDVAEQAFEAVSHVLREEHGAELTRERTTGMVTKARSTWRSGQTHIVLLYMVVGRADPLLNLVYQALPAER